MNVGQYEVNIVYLWNAAEIDAHVDADFFSNDPRFSTNIPDSHKKTPENREIIEK